jgi:hypothetical protein
MAIDIFINSLIYFVAIVAAFFLIMALQIMLRILNWSPRVWNIFPHSFLLGQNGLPKSGYRKRLGIALIVVYVLILAGLAALALR